MSSRHRRWRALATLGEKIPRPLDANSKRADVGRDAREIDHAVGPQLARLRGLSPP